MNNTAATPARWDQGFLAVRTVLEVQTHPLATVRADRCELLFLLDRFQYLVNRRNSHLDLFQTADAQRGHSRGHGRFSELIRGCTGLGQFADFSTHDHHLLNHGAALEAEIPALGAPHSSIELERELVVIKTHSAEEFLTRDVFLLAVRANDPDESLGHDPVTEEAIMYGASPMSMSLVMAEGASLV